MRSVAGLLLLLLPLFAAADERILSFHSDIVVMQDGWIEVTETIQVRVEGRRIRRGIYRDFPTDYRDKLGNEYVVDFQPLAVLRNDRPENLRAQKDRNGVRIYFGRSDYFLDHGIHTYQFRYRASRMLGFFEDHDELYWNVTGFDWAFPIDKASAAVRLGRSTFQRTIYQSLPILAHTAAGIRTTKPSSMQTASRISQPTRH